MGEKTTLQERQWIGDMMKLSLFDLVSSNRVEIQKDIQSKIEAFMSTHDGRIPVTHRDELPVMMQPASAAIIQMVEESLGGDEATALQEPGKVPLSTKDSRRHP